MPGATSSQTGPRCCISLASRTVRACGGGAPFRPPRCPSRDDPHLLDAEPAGDRADRRRRLAVRAGPSAGGASRDPASAPLRGRVFRRTGRGRARPGLADRRLRGGRLQRAHDPAPAAHAPRFLALGAPITLALSATRPATAKLRSRLLRSDLAVVLSNTVVGWVLFVG